MIRRLVPRLLVPLCLIASLLVAAPWLRAFPENVGAIPLFGTAVLSVLVPVVTVRLGARLWLGVLIDLVAFVVYALLVVLHSPAGFADLVDGSYHGPSQILTFALPLVSPRSLMVAPAALTWLAGAIAGQCVTRRWNSVLPYAGFLVGFGLAYAGTERAAGNTLTRDTLLAGGLLATLLMLRTAQAWVRQDQTAESTQADGVLPLRGLVIGAVTTLVLALAASLVVQDSAFPKASTKPQRVPPILDSRPLAPLSFISGLRPTKASAARTVFTVSLDRGAPGYFDIANVDYYDGSGWSFDRTFRPSGGVLPDDADTSLRSSDHVVMQSYRMSGTALAKAPWMPTLYRAKKVTGTPVDIDQGSGMIVPANALHDDSRYTVVSAVPQVVFDKSSVKNATADTETNTATQIPTTLRPTLDKLIEAFVAETGTPSTPALPFLEKLREDLQQNYFLSGPAQGSAQSTISAAPTSATPTPSPSKPSSSTPSSSSRRKTAVPSRTTSAKKSASRKSSARKSSARKSTPKKASSSHKPRDAGERLLAAPAASRSAAKSTARKPRANSSARKSPAKSRAKKSTAKKSAAKKSTAKRTHSATPTPTPTPTGSAADRAGGTSFADVLGSILGQQRSGTPEQFATLMAMVARELGIPARVATGFRVSGENGAVTLAPGAHTVTTADAWTWTEVPIVGRGWLVLDATPVRYSSRTRAPDAAAAQSPSSSRPPTQNALVTSNSGGHAVARKSAVPKTATASRSGALVALLIVLIILVLLLVLVLASRKRVRAARRRRSNDPRERLLGAWHESIDMLNESGLPELSMLTSAEIAALTSEQFGPAQGAQVESLGAVANSVAYSTTTLIDPAQAEQAWAAERMLRRSVRGQLPMPARVGAAMRYHRTKRAQRPAGPESWAASAAARATERNTRRRYHGRRRR